MPLAARMRPRNLCEYMGQKEVLGEGTLLRKAIEEDVLGSLILFGPPGCGKTTLAEVIAAVTKAFFVPMSAISAGKADILTVVREAENRLRYDDKKTILFIDEIHRFNKSQQDALLPSVEQGKITFIGATTENPYFEVNRALISRARIIPLQPLTKEDIKDILIGALEDPDRGLGKYHVEYDDEPLDILAELSGGDARVALNAVETVVSVLKPNEKGRRRLRSSDIEEVLQRRVVRYDKSGDSHYDVTSAFIKSMRG
ncbi:MAG: AAA family ATPase, partial [Clostridia bacterium]